MPLTSSLEQANRKALALEFMRLLRAGDREGATRLITADAKHHSAYFAAGMLALIDAAVQAAQQVPDRTADIKLTVADGDYVVVHSHVRRNSSDTGASVVHLFRFQGDRIAELWDVGQPVPAEMPNADGMF